jgi:hypothetical protein
MHASNPRIVLRNWVAQTAIRAAELGHTNTVQDILTLLRHPYSDEGGATLSVPPAVATAAGAAAGAAAGSAALLAAAAAAGKQAGVNAAAAAAVGDGGGACPASVELRFDGKPPAWASTLCVTCSS